jgi:RIO kinase 2
MTAVQDDDAHERSDSDEEEEKGEEEEGEVEEGESANSKEDLVEEQNAQPSMRAQRKSDIEGTEPTPTPLRSQQGPKSNADDSPDNKDRSDGESSATSELVSRTTNLRLSSDKRPHTFPQPDVRQIVTSDIKSRTSKQESKYHSRKGAQKVGRAKGSKKKFDGRGRVNVAKGDMDGW